MHAGKLERCAAGRRCGVALHASPRASCSLLGLGGMRGRCPRKTALAAVRSDLTPWDVIRAHVSTLMTAAVAMNAILSPLALAEALDSASINNVSSSITSSTPAAVLPPPNVSTEGRALDEVAAETSDEAAAEPQQQQQPQQQPPQQLQQQPQQQWWQADEGNWLELTSPTELLSFINAVQPPPAWPALADSPAPKLKLVEFYARWCGACGAAAPGMAAAAGEPQLQASATFARVNVDRVKPLMKQLGISRIPTVMLLAPDGRVLDTFRASGDAARDAILQHTQALARAEADGQPPAAAAPAVPGEVLPATPNSQGEEEVPLDGSNSSDGSDGGSTATDNSSAAAVGDTGDSSSTSNGNAAE